MIGQILQAKIRMTQSFMGLRKDKRAVTALEYGLIASLIAVAIIGTVTTLGTDLSALFTGIAAKIAAATPK
jgi:pilus assembly protein Flp/PilA